MIPQQGSHRPMTKHSSDNLRIKRKYLVWRKDSKGLSDASVGKSAAAISVYEAFLNGKDFRSFHSERARGFKRHLSSQQNQRNGSKLSASSINGTLREISAFLNWLADQPRYESKITRSHDQTLTIFRQIVNLMRRGARPVGNRTHRLIRSAKYWRTCQAKPSCNVETKLGSPSYS